MTKPDRLPHELDPTKATCLAVIETPKGARGKYDYDVERGHYRLKTILPEGMSFPLDFGFIPSTLAPDGDPLDVMVLIDEPAAVGALVDVRLIGVIEAVEHEKGETRRNDRLLAVAQPSRVYADIFTPDDLPKDYLANLETFWSNKAELEGRTFEPRAVRGPDAAVAAIQQTARKAKG